MPKAIYTQIRIWLERSCLEKAKEQMVSALEQMGLENVKAETVTREFLGETRDALWITAQIQGLEFMDLQIPISHSGCIATLTFSAFSQEEIEQMVGSFYSVS